MAIMRQVDRLARPLLRSFGLVRAIAVDGVVEGCGGHPLELFLGPGGLALWDGNGPLSEAQDKMKSCGEGEWERGLYRLLTSRNSLALLHASSSNLIASPSSSGSVA